MNKLVSGAIGVAVEITGNKIMLPDVLDLKGKRIKHIDFCDFTSETASGKVCTNLYLYADGAITNENSASLNIQEQNTRVLKIKDMSLDLLRVSRRKGNREFINKIIDFPNSFITLTGTPEYGKHIFLVFWYDEPKNMHQVFENGRTEIDSFEIQIKNPQLRRIPFGENRTLFNRMYQNIILFAPLAPGITPLGNPSVAKEKAVNTFITLQRENYKYIRNVPLSLFDQTEDVFPLRLQNIKFEFLNSYLEVAPSVPLVVGESWAFNVELDNNK